MRRDLNPSRVSSERAQALFAQAVTMHQRGSIGEAEQLYRLVLAADKKHPGALQYLAMLEGQRGNLTEARRLLEQWIRSNRRSAEAHTNLGYVLALMGLHQEALAAYDKALSIDPRFLTALNNRGISLRELRRFTDAVSNYDRALSVKPDFADALYNRGNVLNRMGRCAEALADFDRALSISPNDPDTWIGRATALRGLGRANEAVASLDKVLAWVPNNVLALANRGHILSDLRRYEEAIVSYGKALQIDPSHTDARSPMAWAAMAICDWDLSGHLEGELKSDIRDHKSIVQPFMLLAQCDDPALQLTCAQNFVADKVEPGTKLLWKRGDPIRNRGERIRIAYLSADFRQHATAYLITRLLEKHDRSRFEVIGISIGKDDASVERKRIVDAVDAFIDVQRMSDHEIAQLIFKRQIDILVDLNGHAQGGRIGILAYRPAPVQVNYLGYPGTTGADFVDYVVADEIILPMNRQPFYSEQIIQLPDYYAAYDPLFENGLTGADRHDAGLPENGVVFCCFSNNYKITKLVFDVWMRLLQSVEGAVLWLLRDTSTAERNLRKEAVACSVDPSRLVFADRVSLSRHLARQRLADLFLDTSPYNAHTTACDALWMGLPLVTCAGRAFAGRVAASLLTAAGLPELVTTSLDEYEALGRKLATDSALLNSYRERLTRNRASFPPFDADRLRRQIEAAYARMWDIRCNTQSPQGITSGEPASR
jgi:protein O-GlcNAc transferase